MPDNWFAELIEDPTDPSTPMFWETLSWASRQGMDLKAPEVTLPEASLGVQVLELQRQVALKTPTMAMPVLTPVPVRASHGECCANDMTVELEDD